MAVLSYNYCRRIVSRMSRKRRGQSKRFPGVVNGFYLSSQAQKEGRGFEPPTPGNILLVYY